MASPFTVELSMKESPAEAQSRAATGLTDAASAVGLRLTKRSAHELGYRPRVQFPFVIMLWHKLNREQMTVTFDPEPDGGTHVTITGAVARGNRALAANADHWSEALGGSTPASA